MGHIKQQREQQLVYTRRQQQSTSDTEKVVPLEYYLYMAACPLKTSTE